MRFILSKIVLICLINILTNLLLTNKLLADEQIVEPGDLVRIPFDPTWNDIKIKVIPENNKWMAIKTLNNETLIIFLPNAKMKDAYTFIIAGNKDNLTLLKTEVVKIKVVPDPIDPIIPDPVIPNKYINEIKSSYLVSPNADNLDKLIIIFDSITTQTNKVTSYKQLHQLLINLTAKQLKQSDLRPLRDKIAEILVRDLAKQDSEDYNLDKANSVFKELASALKLIK